MHQLKSEKTPQQLGIHSLAFLQSWLKLVKTFLAEQFTDIRVSHVQLGKLAGAFPNDIVSYEAKS